MTLFEECVAALRISGQAEVCGEEHSRQFIREVKSRVPFTRWNRIDWDALPAYETIDEAAPDDLSGDFYIFWNEASLPVVRSDGKNIIANMDDVLAVDFDTWLVSADLSRIIEFHHSGQIRMLRL